jgi:hypothetical protein
MHGWRGAENTTACKAISNLDGVRQQFKHETIRVELGETASSGTFIERLAHTVKRSGGEKTAASMIRQTDAGKFELAKAEFQILFDNRELLCIVDNIWESKDPAVKRWINIIREIQGSKRFLLCSSGTPLGDKMSSSSSSI